MKILLVYPEHPPTFWSFKYALQFTDLKAINPPLGLLTVASMLPKEWEKKLVDMNIEPLEGKQLEWADYVFIGAMDSQKKSATEVINRCNRLGVNVVAGGPLFTENYEDFENVDHFVLGDAETTLPMFLSDLENGTPKHLYTPDGWPDMEKSPPPMWELLDMEKYYHMGIQFSRGCPFDCEFCGITKLFGRKVRTKNKEQIIKELDSLYNLDWRGSIFFVDDNFIGNKHKVKTEILPAVIEWMEKRDYPFWFLTQASINLADDEELMKMMVRAGFYVVFVGIETIDDDCLAEAGKFQNRKRDLVTDVKKLQRHGLEVLSGFIVGFDSDKESTFDRMIQFIQESGITTAMVGLLYVIRGTKLYKRLEEENRLIPGVPGNNMDLTFNFIPKMNRKTLLQGYRKVLKNIYSPEPYYLRILTFIKEYKPLEIEMSVYNSYYLNPKNTYSAAKCFIKSVVILGILDKGRTYYWKLFFWSLIRQPRFFVRAIELWAMGYHFRKVFEI